MSTKGAYGMLNKNWFKHGITCAVILLPGFLALGSGSTEPSVQSSASKKEHPRG
jgi:hypothetical protein